MIRASTTTRRTPRFRRPPTSHPPTSHPRYQPEPLEGRTLLAVFFVGDDAEGVFRDLNTAIALANSNPGPDTIEFRLKPHQLRLTLGSVYNPITDPLTIDGTSQPGFNGTPIVELDGGAVPRATVLPGLTVRAPGCTLRGLVIHSFPRQGIKLDDGSGGATIEQNYIGTDVSGTVARGNGLAGVQVHDSANNTIRRNLISGNGESGIFISSAAATGNRVEGNLIGTDASGMNPLGNAFNGVALAAPDVPFLRQGNDPADGYATGNFIGGRDPAARNVISGNRNTGVFIFRGVSNIVEGNYIGVGPDGITPVPNGPDGPDAEFGADGVAIEEGTNNGIGGVEAGAGNVISGNTRAGVRIRAVTRSANRNWVQGNLIGTDNNGNFNLSLGNGGSGVEIRNESTDSSVIVFDTLVGGDDADDGSMDGVIKARNIVSGNLSAGVLFVGHLVLETKVRGNYIGTNKDGTAAIPNLGAGIDLTTFENQTAGPTHTQIGGTTPGAGNLLSGNESEGVLIQGATGRSHTPTTGGSYTVWVTDNTPLHCLGISIPYIFTGVGMSGSAVADAIRVYPNPATDIVHIDAPVSVNVIVNSMDGKMLFSGKDVRTINIGAFPDGVYRILITNKNGDYLRVDKITKVGR